MFAAKGRPHFNPLICHYPDAAAAFADVEATPLAQALAAAFWPGPLTLVLPRRDHLPGGAAGRRRAGHAGGAGAGASGAAQALLRAVGRPVAAPSANRSGQVSPTTAAHVLDGLDGRIAAVLDSGPCAVGVESTVLDLTGSASVPAAAGRGAAPRRSRRLIGPVRRGLAPRDAEATRTLRSPGLLVSHYAPVLPGAAGRRGRCAPTRRCWRSGRRCQAPGRRSSSAPAGDPLEAAARLFAGLRALDAEAGRLGLVRIAVMPVPRGGARPCHQRPAATGRGAEGISFSRRGNSCNGEIGSSQVQH